MFDIGGSELLVIGVVALIVIGPKDLPHMFRALGQFTAKARGMAREFQRAMEDAAEQSGAGDVTRELRALNSVKNFGLGTMDEAVKRLESWNDNKQGDEPGLQPDPDAPRGPATEELAKQRAEKAEALNEQFGAKTQGVAEGITPEGEAPAPKKTRKTAAKSTAKKTASAKTASAKTASGKTAATKPASGKTASRTASKPGTRTAAAKASATDTASATTGATTGTTGAKPAPAKPRRARTASAGTAARKTAAAKTTETGASETGATPATKPATKKTASRTTTAKTTAAKSRKTPKQSDA